MSDELLAEGKQGFYFFGDGTDIFGPHIMVQVANPDSFFDMTPYIEAMLCGPYYPEQRFKSVYSRPEDIRMAKSQLRYNTTGGREREVQEEWAQKKIKATGQCPGQAGWHRITPDQILNFNGYTCDTAAHFMTDELLAEGKGGYYTLETAVWAMRSQGLFPENGTEIWIEVQFGANPLLGWGSRNRVMFRPGEVLRLFGPVYPH